MVNKQIMKTNKNLYWIIGIVFLVIFISTQKHVILPGATYQSDIPTIQGGWDISAEVEAKGYDIYLVEEKDFDFSNEGIFSIATQIKETTDSPEDAIKRTILYTVQNIKYDGSVSIPYCYKEKASTVLYAKRGDCVSMSRLNTALLRAQGIPARTVGGCLSLNKRCDILFASIPGYMAKTSSLLDEKKRGYLHEYVEVWLPEKEWIRIESTSGQIFSTDCFTYLDYSYDTNNINRCTITDSSFIQECRSY
jgi:transglutaminase-like putative cysteine protease